jgi:peroxiredoxin
MRTERRARGVALLVALTLVAGGCGGASSSGARTAARPADFALRSLDGATVRLSDHLGKDVVLISFWATWCSPCAAEMPHLERIFRSYREQGFVVLAVSMDGPETIAEVAPKIRQNGFTFPVLLDEETRVVGALNPGRAAPLTILIGRDGVIAAVHEGYTAGAERALEDEIRKLL